MLHLLSSSFLVVAVIAAGLVLAGIAGSAARIAQFLFLVSLCWLDLISYGSSQPGLTQSIQVSALQIQAIAALPVVHQALAGMARDACYLAMIRKP